MAWTPPIATRPIALTPPMATMPTALTPPMATRPTALTPPVARRPRAWTPPKATAFAALIGRTVSQAGRAMQLWYHGRLPVTTSGRSRGGPWLGEERRSGVRAPQRPPIPSPLTGERVRVRETPRPIACRLRGAAPPTPPSRTSTLRGSGPPTHPRTSFVWGLRPHAPTRIGSRNTALRARPPIPSPLAGAGAGPLETGVSQWSPRREGAGQLLLPPEGVAERGPSGPHKRAAQTGWTVRPAACSRYACRRRG